MMTRQTIEMRRRGSAHPGTYHAAPPAMGRPIKFTTRREAELWNAVLEDGDVAALRELAQALEPIDDRELGVGD